MKKTYDRKVFKRKLRSRKKAVIVVIRLFMVLLLGFPVLVNAGTRDSTRLESRQVEGKVTDEKKVPLPGVTVRWEGTSVGTATDVEGKIQGVDACGFGNIGGFFYRDEDREGEDSEVEGRRGARRSFSSCCGMRT